SLAAVAVVVLAGYGVMRGKRGASAMTPAPAVQTPVPATAPLPVQQAPAPPPKPVVSRADSNAIANAIQRRETAARARDSIAKAKAAELAERKRLDSI